MYVGETGRRYGTREKEHQKDVQSVSAVKFTRARKKESTTEYHQSALTDHVCQSNHTIDWEKVKRPIKEAQWRIRGIKEAVAIRKAGPHTLNRDEGTDHHLPDVYSEFCLSPQHLAARTVLTVKIYLLCK